MQVEADVSMPDGFRNAIPNYFAFFADFDLPELLRAIASRMSS
jgi:hypothetical protein